MNLTTKLGEQGYYNSKGIYSINTYRLLLNKQLIKELGWSTGLNLQLTIKDGKLIVEEKKD